MKAFFIFCLGLIGAVEAKEVTLTIFSLNDIYQIQPSNGYGGLAEMLTLLKKERDKSEHYLTTINGDFLSPSFVSSVFKGSQMIDLFNTMEVDVVVFGNHEFDYGIDTLKARMDESNFYWLGSNVFARHRGQPFWKTHSTLIFEIDGINVGMLGLVTPDTSNLAKEANDVIFAPIIVSAQAAVHNLKQAGADIIIALTHLNMEDDLVLAQLVPEINVILGGHDHEVYTYYDGKTLVHKSGHDAQYLCRLELKMEKFQKGDKLKTVFYPTWKMIPNYGFPPDEVAEKQVNFYLKKIEEELKQPIAITTAFLDASFIREKETSMGDFFADALRSSLQADVCILNAGSIRGSLSFAPGMHLTKYDIISQVPFGNIGVLIEASGAQILQTLENALSHIEQKSGSFPIVSGMKVVYEETGTPGEKILEAYIDGMPIEKNAIYRVATNDYLLKGGDGNTGLFNTRVLIGSSSGSLLSQHIVDYVMQEQMIEAPIMGRILKDSLSMEVTKVGKEGKRIQFKVD